MLRRFSAVAVGVVLVFSCASAASAATGPVIKLFKDPLPVLGAQVSSDGLGDFAVIMKDGGTITSPYGIKRAQLNYYDVDPTYEILWYYPRHGQAGGATRLAPRGQWNQEMAAPPTAPTVRTVSARWAPSRTTSAA